MGSQAEPAARPEHKQLTPLDLSALSYEIHQLLSEFSYRLDMSYGARLHELFTRDGSYTVDGATLTGQDALRDAFAKRAARGARTSRHLFSNIRFELIEPKRVRVTAAMVLYAADGNPVLLSEPPLMVADVVDVLHFTPEGWRFASREFVSVFRGAAKIVSPMSVTQNPIEGI